MRTWRFSASVAMALQCVLRIIAGNFTFIPKGTVLPKGAALLDTARQRVEAPVWCNFVFFSRITATPIQRVEIDDWAWRMEREIRFFHGDAVVAVVTLVGEDDATSGWTGWAVSKIRYALVCDSARHNTDSRWVELELEVFSYTLLPIPDQG